MAIGKELQYIPLDKLLLDPQNPRLGRDKRRAKLNQGDLLKEMASWTLEELIDSFSQSGGFWTQDALIVVEEQAEGKPTGNFIVIEGNRRLAALKLLHGAIAKTLEPPKWLAERLGAYSPKLDDEIFTKLPVLIAEKRDDVLAYLGFRHVTGIKQWRPAEKAEFIVSLVDDGKLTYKEVAKQIGSRSDTVRQNYLAFKMLLQMEEIENFDWSEVEERFSLLFLSVRSEGTREFLGVELKGDAPTKQKPIPDAKKDNAKAFVGWLFGTKEKRGIVGDSRNVDRFGEILAEPKAVEYLKKNPEPDFETAYILAAASDLVVAPLQEAARQIRLALSELADRGKEGDVKEAAWPVIEGGIKLAHQTGEDNLGRAREMLRAA
jgi:hypothetical protein